MAGQLGKVAAVLRKLEAVVECDRITGEDRFIAKAHVRSVPELEALIDEINPYAMTNAKGAARVPAAISLIGCRLINKLATSGH